jgi:hypothetical protein
VRRPFQPPQYDWRDTLQLTIWLLLLVGREGAATRAPQRRASKQAQSSSYYLRATCGRPKGASCEKRVALHHPLHQKSRDSVHLCFAIRRDGNGVPSLRAWSRTLIIVRFNAAAARTTDAPLVASAFRRWFSSSVQTGDLIGFLIWVVAAIFYFFK